jgi:ATP-dependent exoDNAse (exonuclease V) alpha subunit
LIDADKAIPWVEKRTKLALAESQIEAVRVALASKVLVITGGPGVGKTTLVNSILKILLAKTVAIALCAPTGRAAKRLSESTGLEAKTIHRLLETDPRTGAFRRTDEAPLDCEMLVVDETSMVDVPLMRCRSTAVGRARTGSGRHYRIGCCAGRALDRGLPPSCREPDYRQRASHQPGPDARPRSC